jgi:hypothetical protein
MLRLLSLPLSSFPQWQAVGREMLLHYIRYLLCSYASDASVQAMVNATDIFVIITSNPDGYVLATPTEGDCFFDDEYAIALT